MAGCVPVYGWHLDFLRVWTVLDLLSSLPRVRTTCTVSCDVLDILSKVVPSDGLIHARRASRLAFIYAAL